MEYPKKYDSDIEVLYESEAVQKRVIELGQQISCDYEGKTVHVVGVLKGSFIFMADLIRAIDRPVFCDFIGISSYGDAQESSGVVRITNDLKASIEGNHVLIVEDIIDTGLTMDYLFKNLATRKPASVKVATLLHKPDNTKVEVPIDYTGFSIPNRFVIGYGLDFKGLYRDLSYIGVYRGPV